MPWENVIPKFWGSFVRDKVEKADYHATRLLPNLFAGQHLFELRLSEGVVEGAADNR